MGAAAGGWQSAPSREGGAAPPEHPRFRHEALFYSEGDEGFVRGTLPAVERALAHQAPVLVAVRSARAAALSDALGEDAGRLRFLGIEELGRNPARIIPAWQQFLYEEVGGASEHALGIGEPVWPGRAPAELEECVRHEALLNLAFHDGPAWRLLCPYDLDGLDDGVLESACATHPCLVRDGASQRSGGYVRLQQAPSPFAGSLSPPAGEVRELAFTRTDLPGLRGVLARWAAEQLLDGDGTEELVLAVDELATNSIFYGGGRGTLRFWTEQGRLVCEVEDQGRLEAPLLGRIRPRPDAQAGRGLWLANQLCDLVQIRSGPAGTVVRVHKRLT